MGIFGKIKDWLKDRWQDVKRIAAPIVKPVLNAAGAAGRAVLDAAKGAAQRVMQAAPQPVQLLGAASPLGMSALLTKAAVDNRDDIGQAAKTVVEGVKDAAPVALNVASQAAQMANPATLPIRVAKALAAVAPQVGEGDSRYFTDPQTEAQRQFNIAHGHPAEGPKDRGQSGAEKFLRGVTDSIGGRPIAAGETPEQIKANTEYGYNSPQAQQVKAAQDAELNKKGVITDVRNPWKTIVAPSVEAGINLAPVGKGISAARGVTGILGTAAKTGLQMAPLGAISGGSVAYATDRPYSTGQALMDIGTYGAMGAASVPVGAGAGALLRRGANFFKPQITEKVTPAGNPQVIDNIGALRDTGVPAPQAREAATGLKDTGRVQVTPMQIEKTISPSRAQELIAKVLRRDMAPPPVERRMGLKVERMSPEPPKQLGTPEQPLQLPEGRPVEVNIGGHRTTEGSGTTIRSKQEADALREKLNKQLFDTTEEINKVGRDKVDTRQIIGQKDAQAGLKQIDDVYDTLPDKAPAQPAQAATPEQPMAVGPAGAPPVAPEDPNAVRFPGGQRERGQVTTAKEGTNVPDETKALLEGEYTQSSSREMYDEAYRVLNENPQSAGQVFDYVFGANAGDSLEAGFRQRAAEAVQKGGTEFQKLGAYSRALFNHYNDIGDHAMASRILNETAPVFTEAGQLSQTGAMINSLGPAGIERYMTQMEKKMGQTLDDDFKGWIKERMTEMRDLPDQSSRNLEAMSIMHDIAGEFPNPLGDRVVNFWKAGLLTSLTTHGGNILSNTVHGIMEVTKDVPAVIVDVPLSALTGRRSKALTVRGLMKGGGEGLEEMWRFISTGIDKRGVGMGKLDVNKVINNGNGAFGKALTAYENFIFRMVGSEDMVFYYAAKTRSLYDQGIVAIRNGEITRSQLKDFVKNPPEDVLKIAGDEASTAVFQNNTKLGMIASSLAEHGGFIGQMLAPFRRTPSAVAMQLFNYTPIGAGANVIKSVVRSVKQGKFTQAEQRQLVQNLGRGVTGTGAMYVGMKLYDADLITLSYPEDEDERRLWELEGKQPYSIKIGNKWRSFNYASPLGQLLAAGGFVKESYDKTGSISSAATVALPAIAKTLTDQSFLKGVGAALGAITRPQMFAEQLVEQYAGSVVPSIFGSVARAADPYQREINSPWESIKSRVPGARETLRPKLNMFGEPIERQGSAAETLLDPTRPSEVRNDPLVPYLRQIQEQGQPLYAPGPPEKKSTIGGQKDVQLDDEQYFRLRQMSGQLMRQQISQAVNSDAYQGLSAEEKRKALEDAGSDARAISKYFASKEFGIGSPEVAYDELETRAKKIVIGEQPDYARDRRLKTEQADFERANKPKITPDIEKQYTEYLSLPEKSQQRRDYLASHGGLQGYFDAKNDYLFAYKDKFGKLPFGEKEPFKRGKGGGKGYRRGGGRRRGGRRLATPKAIKIGASTRGGKSRKSRSGSQMVAYKPSAPIKITSTTKRRSMKTRSYAPVGRPAGRAVTRRRPVAIKIRKA